MGRREGDVPLRPHQWKGSEQHEGTFLGAHVRPEKLVQLRCTFGRQQESRAGRQRSQAEIRGQRRQRRLVVSRDQFRPSPTDPMQCSPEGYALAAELPSDPRNPWIKRAIVDRHDVRGARGRGVRAFHFKRTTIFNKECLQ